MNEKTQTIKKEKVSAFECAIAFTVNKEGGYVNNLKDKGGETNFGISKRSYPKLDIKNLTEAKAKTIYKRDFWDALSCDELPKSFAIALFDFAVNSGQKKAVSLLQKALKVKVDGIIGKQTIGACQKAGLDELTNFYSFRVRYYHSLHQPTFIQGWLNRTFDCFAYVQGEGNA